MISHFFPLETTRIKMFVMNDWTSKMFVMGEISKLLLLQRNKKLYFILFYCDSLSLDIAQADFELLIF